MEIFKLLGEKQKKLVFDHYNDNPIHTHPQIVNLKYLEIGGGLPCTGPDCIISSIISSSPSIL